MQGTRWSQGSEEEDGEQVLQPGSQDQDQHYVNDADRHHTDQDHHHDPSRKKTCSIDRIEEGVSS